MGDAEQILARIEPDITALDAAQWDACANPESSGDGQNNPYNPFICHAFLSALEESGSATVQTGWAPRHLVLDDGSGGMAACMPCYLKSHSQGEYVFDYGWADAFERAGGSYYPKLQACVPFTPVSGRRLLVPHTDDTGMRERYLLNASAALLERYQASSLHLTFLTRQEWDLAGKIGLLRRTDQQFHWFNQGYDSFDDFTACLTSRKRKLIKRERRGARAEGITIRLLTGSDLSEAHWDAFYAFYTDTGARKWGHPNALGSAALLERYQASSLHLTFLTRQEWDLAGKIGLLRRTDQQFHWFNQGYDSFDDFTACLTSRKRKLIKRERRGARAEGITIRLLTGSDLSEAHWDAFYAFYTDTGARKWGHPYLTREFFSLVGQSMAERILLILCERAGRPIAGALNFIGGDTLYGRYWGCLETHPFLHFEACYYQAIEYAITHGLARVEAGAQGQHKLARGYLPQTTYSAHMIADPSLRSAVARFLIQERGYVEMENEELSRFAPYRKTTSKPPKNDA